MDEVIAIVLMICIPLLSLIVLPIVILVKISGIKKELTAIKERVYHVPTSAPIPAKEEPTPATILESAPEQPAVTQTPKPAPPPLPPMPTKQAPEEKNKVVWEKPQPTAENRISIAAAEKKSKLMESVNEILTKTWNWIVYGAEKRPTDVSMEYILASTWLPRVGIAAFFFCVIFFLRWSMERNLISNIGRVAIGIIFGIGMLVSGIKLLGKKYHVIGQCLLGGGILVLYACVWAASPMMFSIISITTAFGLMILVTVTAGFLSVRTNSMLIAIIGIIGAFLTPVLLKTPDPNLTAFFSYLLMLNLGILGIAHYKQWRLLNYLGFIFTYALFYGAWQHGPYNPERHFNLAISFLTLLFVIHSSLVYMYNILKSKHSTVLEIVHLVANAGVYSIFAYFLIMKVHDKPYPAVMSIGLAVFFIVHVLAFLKRKLIDRNLLLVLIALSGIFTAWTLPLVFEKESLTISLSLFALMLFWLSRKLESNFMQNLGYLAYLVIFVRLLFFDMPRNFDFKPTLSTTMSVYWKAMAQRLWTFGTSIASVITAFYLQRGKLKISTSALDRKNDMPNAIKKNAVSQAFYWCAVIFIFLFLNFEMNTMFSHYMPLRLPMLTILWCGMAGYFLWKYITDSENTSGIFNVMVIFLMFAFLKIFIFDLRSWNFCDSLYYNIEYNGLYAGMRFLDFGAVMALFFTTWWILMGRGDQKKIAYGFGYGGLLLFFVYISLETNSLLHWKEPDFQSGGISVLWAIFAISFIIAGIWKNITPLRFLGLILFVIVAGKVFMLDLKDMDMIYRVIAFMVLGVTLLLGSFAYIKSNKKFIKE